MRSGYYEAHGWTCNFCFKTFKAKSYRHPCREFKKSNCEGCNRICRENVLIYHDTKKQYCDAMNHTETIKEKEKEERKEKNYSVLDGPVLCIDCNVYIKTGMFSSLQVLIMYN